MALVEQEVPYLLLPSIILTNQAICAPKTKMGISTLPILPMVTVLGLSWARLIFSNTFNRVANGTAGVPGSRAKQPQCTADSVCRGSIASYAEAQNEVGAAYSGSLRRVQTYPRQSATHYTCTRYLHAGFFPRSGLERALA
jgi:hypothetical protein